MGRCRVLREAHRRHIVSATDPLLFQFLMWRQSGWGNTRAAGFHDAMQMFAVFKRVEGIIPSAYRRQHH